MASVLTERRGEACVDKIRATLRRLRLGEVHADFDDDRGLVCLSWPHENRAGATEQVEFPATAEWAERVSHFLEKHARTRKRPIRYSVA
jgi:hypothetical protein